MFSELPDMDIPLCTHEPDVYDFETNEMQRFLTIRQQCYSYRIILVFSYLGFSVLFIFLIELEQGRPWP